MALYLTALAQSWSQSTVMGDTTCLDPTYTFQDFETFSRCFSSWRNTTNFSKAVVYVDTPFGKVIDGCIQDYCNFTSPDLGGCTLPQKHWSDIYQLRSHPNVSFESSACAGLNSRVNTDIAGPGVCFLDISDSREVVIDCCTGHYIL